MSNVYGLWYQVGAYEGEDSLLGVYSSKEAAQEAQRVYIQDNSEDEVYISCIQLDQKAEYMWDIKGDLVDAVA